MQGRGSGTVPAYFIRNGILQEWIIALTMMPRKNNGTMSSALRIRGGDMTDREEREEHIKRLEAALACEEKQSSGKCSKQTCDDNCDLLYEQGNWGEWKETLRYAINSLKIDLKYDLLYEETSGQADKQADKPTTKNDVPDINVGKIGLTTKNDCISRKAVQTRLKEIINEMETIFADIREREVNDSVCGLCEYDCDHGLDGFANECPGFEKDDCFKLNEKYKAEWLDISNLPSVTPQEPRKGEWLRMSDLSEQEDDRYKCSHCGNVIHHKNKMYLYTFNSWCGRCGSDNREVEE